MAKPRPTARPERARRSAGVLLHVTSLPGRYGIGDLGPAAFAWIDSLEKARQTWWQVLPLGPPGAGDSPYQCYSAFAGNSALLSPDVMLRDGLLRRADLPRSPLPQDEMDYTRANALKRQLLAIAWERFQSGAARPLRSAFDAFRKNEATWLEDYALFMALKEVHNDMEWTNWPRPLVFRRPAALQEARRELSDAIGRHQFAQFLFFRQLDALRTDAHAKGIRLIGDLPIFVSGQSADVWANPHLFELDKHRRPRAVAGVPPDYFSRTGQRWGNPLYAWDSMRSDHYRWWIDRVRATLRQVDLVRIDHFRGFEAYWRIPAHLPTAERGRWVKAPGREFFQALQKELGHLPLIAEDLGVITPEVDMLRDEFDLPGMRVLQFAFGGGPDNPFLPHNYVRSAVAYTGTHDNDTTAGWFATLDKRTQRAVRQYTAGANGNASEVAWDFIRLAWSSVADIAIAPLQDVLGLGSAARMNIPGTAEGNWGWRYRPEMLKPYHLARLADLTNTYGRSPHPLSPRGRGSG